MKFYAIIYDLRQPGRRYDELYDAIKSVAGDGNWQHPMESFWVLAISDYLCLDDANDIYNRLREYIDSSDSLIVCRMDMADNQGWMPNRFWNWIKEQKNKL